LWSTAQVHSNIKILELFLEIYFFRINYLRQPSIDFDFCNLSSSGDVVYKERAGDIDNSWLLIFVMILCAFKGKPQSVQIFIFLIGYMNVNKVFFGLIISYLRIKSYNVLNYNNCSTDWSFPLS
jgi:hypothetical protein